jgi:2-haloacid dehalogenase
MSQIKVILWDIDGTLLNFEEAEKYAIRACFAQFHLGECTDSMLADYSTINRGYWQRLERGELTKPQVLEGRFMEFFGKYGLDTSCAPAFNAQYQISLGDTFCFHENGLETVQALKGKVKQYAVTNGTRIAQERKLRVSGLGDLLDGVFISEEVGIEKPGIGFFQRVWDAIGTYHPEEVMIIGDSLTSDIQGGNNAGILCCWFNPQGKPAPDHLHIEYTIQELSQVLDIIKLS